jgi:hypothetical protein
MEKTKKIFVLVLPDHGHINPIACVLAQYKLDYPHHEIVFYGTPQVKPVIERAGCTYREYTNTSHGIDLKFPRPVEQRSTRPYDPLLSRLCLFQLSMWDKCLPGLIEDVERERPDLIVYDVFAMQAKYLLRAIKLRYKNKKSSYKPPPAIMFATTFAQKFGVFPTLGEVLKMVNFNFGLFINMFFAILQQIFFSWKHGLDILNVFSLLKSHDEKTVIVTIFPEFQPKRDKFNDPPCKFVGSCVSESVRKYEVNDDRLKYYMDSFEPVNPRNELVFVNSTKNERKLVYASLGTVDNNYPFIFEDIINAVKMFDQTDNSTVKSSQIEVIISTGKGAFENLQAKIKNKQLVLPSNVLLQQSVPQIEVLKRVSLFITHGGMNSANEAILYAVPVICIPIMV